MWLALSVSLGALVSGEQATDCIGCRFSSRIIFLSMNTNNYASHQHEVAHHSTLFVLTMSLSHQTVLKASLPVLKNRKSS